MAGGMGAPKQQNRTSEDTSCASMFGAFRVSCRNGVAAEVQGDLVLFDELDEPLVAPHILVDAGRADLGLQAYPVEQAGEVRDGGRHVDDAVAAHAEPLG